MNFDFPFKKGSGIPLLTTNLSPQCLSLLHAMVAYDPDERIAAHQALQHPYFQEQRTQNGSEDEGLSRPPPHSNTFIPQPSAEHLHAARPQCHPSCVSLPSSTHLTLLTLKKTPGRSTGEPSHTPHWRGQALQGEAVSSHLHQPFPSGTQTCTSSCDRRQQCDRDLPSALLSPHLRCSQPATRQLESS
nr:RAGE-4 ORF3; one of 2 possible coding regions [Homo sapiens]